MKYGFYPQDLNQAYIADAAYEELKFLIEKVYKNFFSTNEEEKKVVGGEILTVDFPNFCGSMSKKLEKNGKNNFLVGSSLTTSDICIGVVSADWYDEKNPAGPMLRAVLDKHPIFKAYVENL